MKQNNQAEINVITHEIALFINIIIIIFFAIPFRATSGCKWHTATLRMIFVIGSASAYTRHTFTQENITCQGELKREVASDYQNVQEKKWFF